MDGPAQPEHTAWSTAWAVVDRWYCNGVVHRCCGVCPCAHGAWLPHRQHRSLCCCQATGAHDLAMEDAGIHEFNLVE